MTRFGLGARDPGRTSVPISLSGPENGPESPDSAGSAPEDPEAVGVVWRRSVAGPRLLLAGYAVAVSPHLVERLGVTAPPGWPCGLLLCLADDLSLWSRAGDAATVLALVNGYRVDPAAVSRRLPFVGRGWPQHWSGCPLGELVPDRLPMPVCLVR